MRFAEAAVAHQLAAVRAACLVLPRVCERLSHGSPAFFVGPRWFASFMVDHHGDGRLALWYAAPAGVQTELLELEPDRFFRPPYVGHRGWVGVLLDTLQPDELRALCESAWACSAPPTAGGAGRHGARRPRSGADQWIADAGRPLRLQHHAGARPRQLAR